MRLVKLVQATPDAGKMIADIASICYGREEAKNPGRLLRNLLKLGHGSTFEHIYYTFKIEGISRTALGQLTRHRHASYTVRSSRYCDEREQGFLIPLEGLENEEQLNEVRNAYQASLTTYDNLINMGVKREDARFVLPQALSTDLYMSLNLRELIHLNNVRNTKQAQWEIRDLVNEMTMLVVENSPELTFMFKEE